MFLDGNGPSFLVNKVDRPTVRESKTVLDSGFHAGDSWFQVLDSSLCQWKLDSEFQVPFSAIPELYSGFRSPGLRIPQTKISRILQTRFPAYMRWGRGRPWIAQLHDTRDCKMPRRRQQRERQKSSWLKKQNNNSAPASRFLYFFLPSLRDYAGKCIISCFMEDVNKRRLSFLSVSELKYDS